MRCSCKIGVEVLQLRFRSEYWVGRAGSVASPTLLLQDETQYCTARDSKFCAESNILSEMGKSCKELAQSLLECMKKAACMRNGGDLLSCLREDNVGFSADGEDCQQLHTAYLVCNGIPIHRLAIRRKN